MTTTLTRTRYVMPGLRPEPLASYLAGLGLIRVLAEQAEKNATAAWTPDGLAIVTEVSDIAHWLAHEYVPTPVLSPWNKGSGFGAKDKEPIRRLDALKAHPSSRLRPLRDCLSLVEAVMDLGRQRGWITESDVIDKHSLVLELRNRCPDELLGWIDAAIVLADQATFFPPVLGTGGNDARLDFSTNYHQQLIEIVGITDKDRALSRAKASDFLAGSQVERLDAVPIGQYDPGNAGGPGSSRFGSAETLANPWSLVMCVEGAIMFAASATRRNQHAAGHASVPFTVEWSPDASVSGSSAEKSHGEVWVPLWSRGLTLAEIRQLFSEARASWRGRPARKAVDFYAATRALGVSRGIDQFIRYGIHQRNGQSHMAVPLDRIVVRQRPTVKLAAAIEDWVSRVGGSDASTAVAEANRGFQKAHLEFARDGGSWALARMLAALTTLEMAVGRSGRAREAVPVRYAPAAGPFLDVLTDIEGPELPVAVGIASCATWPTEGPARTMRQILLPVDPAERGSQPRWRAAPIVPGFGARPLANVLADVLIWRSRTAAAEHDAAKFRGVPTFPSGIPVPAADLHALAGGQLDDARLDLLLRACLALTWRNVTHAWPPAVPDVPVTTLGLLHPLAAGLRPGNRRDEPDDEPIPGLSPEWATRLAAGQVRQVHDEAAARLRQAGWTAVPAPPEHATPDGTRIAAAVVPRCQRTTRRAVLRTLAFETNPQSEELS